MAVLARYTQSPNERLRYTLDYSNWLSDGETLTDVDFVITPTTDTPLVVDGNAFTSGDTALTYYVSGGEDGQTYKVEVFIATSDGQTKEDVTHFTIRDP